MLPDGNKQSGKVAALVAVALGAYLLGGQKADPKVEVDAAYSADEGASFNLAMEANGAADEPNVRAPQTQAFYGPASSEQREPSPNAVGIAEIYFANCSEAHAAGAAPVRIGDPGYAPHLDRDDDGIGCEVN